MTTSLLDGQTLKPTYFVRGKNARKITLQRRRQEVVSSVGLGIGHFFGPERRRERKDKEWRVIKIPVV